VSLLELEAMPPKEQAAPPEPAGFDKPPAPAPVEDTHILRFYRSERWLHWALAAPFLACFASAMVLVMVYNPEPQRPYRDLFSWIHRISGLALSVLPLFAISWHHRDLRLHFYNIRQAWIWVFDDIKWLGVLAVSAVNKKAKLPDQGKFNAAEKINFMVLMTTYPLYILTGALMWLTHVAFLAWIFHVLMAFMAGPLVLGHMYMALIDRGGRPGLTGMFTGWVPREWAKHHYRHWYREHHEAHETATALPAPVQEESTPAETERN
jgi:formate dehydrogenase gamma subunit